MKSESIYGSGGRYTPNGYMLWFVFLLFFFLIYTRRARSSDSAIADIYLTCAGLLPLLLTAINVHVETNYNRYISLHDFYLFAHEFTMKMHDELDAHGHRQLSSATMFFCISRYGIEHGN